MIYGFSEEESDSLTIFHHVSELILLRLLLPLLLWVPLERLSIRPFPSLRQCEKSTSKTLILQEKTFLCRESGLAEIFLGQVVTPCSLPFSVDIWGLIIWFKDLSYSMGEIVNSKVFSEEMITILTAGIGVALVIPIAAAITAYHLVSFKHSKE